MPIGILNNIPSLSAENALTTTAASLNSTLEQLSSGSRINSGADDPAGLSIANGLSANIAALTQSVSNANDGVGELQLADGALAQVTNLLNTAVTLATESATGTVSDSQRTAIQAQYASILAEINQIGTATTYNGQSVFQGGSAPNLNAADSANNATTAPVTLNTVLTPGGVTSVSAGGVTFSYTAAATGGSNPNEVASASTTLTAATIVASGTVLTATRATGTTIYTATAATTVGALENAINTGAAVTGITVTGTDAAHTGYQAALVAGSLNLTDLNNNGDLTVAETGDPNTNQVQSSVATLTNATVLASGDVITLTRAGGTSIYTASAATTVGNLIAAINTGTGTGFGVTGTDSHNNYTAALVGGKLQVTDGDNGNDLTVSQGTGAELGSFTDLTNKTLGTFTTNSTATSTVQNLINAINSDTTVGAKATLTGGQVVVTDPLGRTDLQVTTTDTLLGATVEGAATNFTTPTTTAAATPDKNELIGNSGSLTANSALTANAVTSFSAGGKTFTYTAASSGSTVGGLIAAINNPSDTAGLQAYLSNGNLEVVDPNNNSDLAVSSTNTETILGTFTNPATTASTTTNIFLSDSTSIGSTQIAVSIGGLTTTGITNGSGGQAADLANTDLTTQTDAQNALNVIYTAIANVASTRGTLGASVNRLTAASAVINSQVENLTSAENTITAADIPTVVAHLTKYSILEQTGISALAQANQQQQLVLKLLQ